MIEWSEEQQMVRKAVRDFVDSEIRPHREELEFGDMAPYDLLRKMLKTFGMDAMARDSFHKRIARERAAVEPDADPTRLRRSRTRARSDATRTQSRSR